MTQKLCAVGMRNAKLGNHLNGGLCTLNIFHHQVNSLVNIESLQDNHDKLVLEYFYHLSPSISDSYLPLHFPKQEILDGRLIGVKTIEKNLQVVVSTKRWPWPLNSIFLTNFGALITVHLIRGGRLIEMQLYIF